VHNNTPLKAVVKNICGKVNWKTENMQELSTKMNIGMRDTQQIVRLIPLNAELNSICHLLALL
jgi:hypothetical protein